MGSVSRRFRRNVQQYLGLKSMPSPDSSPGPKGKSNPKSRRRASRNKRFSENDVIGQREKQAAKAKA